MENNSEWKINSLKNPPYCHPYAPKLTIENQLYSFLYCSVKPSLKREPRALWNARPPPPPSAWDILIENSLLHDISMQSVNCSAFMYFNSHAIKRFLSGKVFIVEATFENEIHFLLHFTCAIMQQNCKHIADR